ncbi:hypothetical protein [Fuerstiella marisgermanici]|uniref:Uncharacterized protein n=1 Tax=Fuerstiella marisgermanici TaxID=1891926 RepID=A0A1P8WQP5_9PLAN|nr:hypothetical protein [Fuerstiella marisgermanici]APZ96369.1 hypothetical protein Fuma_06038 [Fuerstiella marisgermanici]
MTTDTVPPYRPDISSLLAQPHDPWLGAHELSEYTFCDRAGLNTTHLEAADHGQDDNHVPPLDYQPEYDPDAIQRYLHVYSVRVVSWGMACMVMTLLRATTFQNNGLTWLMALLSSAGFLILGISDAGQLLFWYRQYWRSRMGDATLPDPVNPEPEAIHWWHFHRAGFVSASTVGGLQDDELHLAGQPFKLLQRGNEYVPVFLKRGDSTRLFPQHFVRIAVYCLLLQRQTNGIARYGLVLNAGTFDCVAIKFNRESFDLLSLNLIDARRTARHYRELDQSPPPPKPYLCRKCPFGKPLSVDTAESLIQREQTGLVPRANIGSDGRRYHAHCGDRFHWMPPHQQVVELGIPH